MLLKFIRNAIAYSLQFTGAFQYLCDMLCAALMYIIPANVRDDCFKQKNFAARMILHELNICFGAVYDVKH